MVGCGEARARGDHVTVGVLAELREPDDGDAGGFEKALDRGRVSGRDDAGVGDQQGADETKLAGDVTGAMELPRPKITRVRG